MTTPIKNLILYGIEWCYTLPLMTFIAAILIITSAFMHASWNLISKRRSPTLAFFWIASISGSLITLPLLFIYRQALPLVPLQAWGLLLLTGTAQAVYFTGLSGAYRLGDMSLAYPLARALPVLGVAAVNLLIGKGDQIGQLSLIGMGLIFVGCVILPLKQFNQLNWQTYTDKIYLMAIVAAIGTTSYTLLDDTILRQLRMQLDASRSAVAELSMSTTEVTILFIALQVLSTAIMVGTVTLLNRKERQILQEIIANRPLLYTGLLTGAIIMATYGLVLASLAYVRNVSYVAAFRQLSIPIGAIMGMTLQQEARHRPKLLGIAIITAGLILVGIG